ncbi:MAG: ABC transporter ATP-binding protein [Burkholderiales bacterium]
MTLQVNQLVKHFGGVKALDGVSFAVQPGECVALIGPNGAGKSTCFACIAGQLAASSGTVAWNGQALLGRTPAQRLRLGIARTFQVAQTFEALTVLQNLQLLLTAPQGLRGWNTLDDSHAEAALDLLARVGLHEQAQRDALTLPYGAKKRLELALALAGLQTATPGSALPSQAKLALLLLDEPAAGLAPIERTELMALVRTLAAGGLAVLYTEHNMDAVFGIADRVLVLMDGVLVAQGSPQVVAANEVVRSRYLGRSFKSRPDALPVKATDHA